MSAQMRDRDDGQATDSIVSENADEVEAAEPGEGREPGAPPVVENE